MGLCKKDTEKCFGVEIGLVDDFPLTFIDNSFGVNSEKLFLKNIMHPEDIPPFADMLSHAVMSGKERLNTHCRLMVDDVYHWFYFCCKIVKDAQERAIAIKGTIIDVSEYIETTDQDMVMLQYINSNAAKAKLLNGTPSLLVEMLGVDYLREIQKAFGNYNHLVSVILDSNQKFICSLENFRRSFDAYDFLYHRESTIRLNHVVAGYWVIASNTPGVVEKAASLLETLTKTLSRIGNAFLVLYNETENSKRTNKQLGDNIQNQMLINNLYSVILKEPSPEEALNKVMAFIGEELSFDQILVYQMNENDELTISFTWYGKKASHVFDEKLDAKLSDLFKGELLYYDIYFSDEPSATIKSPDGVPFAAVGLMENGNFEGMVFFGQNSPSRVLTTQERKLLRGISQIVSTAFIRYSLGKTIEEKNRELQVMAFNDVILGISNRTSLDIDLNTALKKDEYGALLSIKIVNLRYINEIYGHSYADRIIKQMIAFIESTSGPIKKLYRFTGSIFMLLLHNSTRKDVISVARQLITRFKSSWEIDNAEHYFDVGLGVAMYPENGKGIEVIYSAATLAMYRSIDYAKNEYVFYSEELQSPVKTDYYLEQQLRMVVTTNINDFKVKFQPIYLLKNKKIVFYETLVCWDDPRLGEIPPKKFIKLAEDMGLDIMINRWLVPKAIAFCKRMQQKTNNTALKVSINITFHELRKTETALYIKDMLKRYGLSPESLILEIPEKAQIKLYPEIVYALTEFRKMGVVLAADRFGEEYLSLNMLKNGFFTMVKINESFFTNTDDYGRIMMNSILLLCKLKNVKICIRKIDHQKQFELVSLYNVDYVEGNYFGKAYDENELLNFNMEEYNIE